MPRLRTESSAFNGEGIKCPYCRVSNHYDAWEMEDYKRKFNKDYE